MSQERIRNTFKKRADRYDSEASWIQDNNLLDAIVPLPFGNGKLLDLCSGTGAVAKHAVSKGWNVTAIDASAEMMHAIHNNAIQVIQCNAETLPFENRSYDLVTCRQGLQYLNLPEALKEIARVTTTEIRLAHITSEVAEDEKWWRNYFDIVSPGRKHIFSPFQIAKFLSEYGLIIQEQVILKTRGSFCGPLQYLDVRARETAIHLLETSPAIMSRYEMKQLSNGDIEYSHRWEIYIIKAT